MSTSLDVAPEENERRAATILHQVQHDLGATVFFEKPLTASDASGSGRVVIPKAIAEQYFPRLDQPSGLPVRAVDTRGHEYTFKFRFWINNQSRMYLLEGAGELHRQFTMVVGDVMVFAQKQDRTLVVAGRPATKNDVIRKAPVKRPAGEPKEKSKPGAREPRVKQPKQQAGAAAAPHRKKAKPNEQYMAPPLELEPAVDGIFRAVPDSAASTEASGVAPGLRGRWVVTLNLAGELYQALFDTQEDADEAFNAAGGFADSLLSMMGTTGQVTQHQQQQLLLPQPGQLPQPMDLVGGGGVRGLHAEVPLGGLGRPQQQQQQQPHMMHEHQLQPVMHGAPESIGMAAFGGSGPGDQQGMLQQQQPQLQPPLLQPPLQSESLQPSANAASAPMQEAAAAPAPPPPNAEPAHASAATAVAAAAAANGEPAAGSLEGPTPASAPAPALASMPGLASGQAQEGGSSSPLGGPVPTEGATVEAPGQNGLQGSIDVGGLASGGEGVQGGQAQAETGVGAGQGAEGAAGGAGLLLGGGGGNV